MKRYRFKKVDAFVSGQSLGNPAGCIYYEDEMAPEDMQRIARELQGFVSEVVFCRKSGAQSYDLLYYSAECEVEFCGHGTIACMYDLVSSTPDLTAKSQINISTPKGELVVYNDLASTDAVYITAPKPIYNKFGLDAGLVADKLNISRDQVNERLPLEGVNAGLNTLIVPLNGLQDIIAISPELNTLKKFCLEKGIDIITVFSQDVGDKGNNVRTRVFAPKFGYLEDPATGSGNSALGYYLLRNGLWQGESIIIEQGPSLIAPNLVKLKTISENGSKRVIFGGKAIVRIDGEYLIY